MPPGGRGGDMGVVVAHESGDFVLVGPSGENFSPRDGVVVVIVERFGG